VRAAPRSRKIIEAEGDFVPTSEGAPALVLGLQGPLAPLAMSHCSLKHELMYLRGKHKLGTGFVANNNKLATGLVANNNNY
jgi:hypothetical protein